MTRLERSAGLSKGPLPPGNSRISLPTGAAPRIGRKFVDRYHPALATYEDVRGQHAELLRAPAFQGHDAGGTKDIERPRRLWAGAAHLHSVRRPKRLGQPALAFRPIPEQLTVTPLGQEPAHGQGQLCGQAALAAPPPA